MSTLTKLLSIQLRLLILLRVLDSITTAVGLNLGAQELNPAVVRLMSVFGMYQFLISVVAVVALAAVVVEIVSDGAEWVFLIIVALFNVLCVVTVITNVMEIASWLL